MYIHYEYTTLSPRDIAVFANQPLITVVYAPSFLRRIFLHIIYIT